MSDEEVEKELRPVKVMRAEMDEERQEFANQQI
jgi:hypothetical protein